MTYAWFDFGNGRSVYRRIVEPKPERSALPTPYLAGDTMDPVQSMADGRTYTSKAAMRASYKASGNPAGVEYTEIGNDASWRDKERPQAKPDPKGVDEAIKKAIARVGS